MNSFTPFRSMHFRDLKNKDCSFNTSSKGIFKVKNYFIERSLLFLIAFLLVCSFSTKIYSQEKEREKQLIETIVKDWQDRFYNIKTVRYQYEITKESFDVPEFNPKPGNNTDLPSTPKVDQTIRYELFLDTENKRVKMLAFTSLAEGGTIWNGKFLHGFSTKPTQVKKSGLVDSEINQEFLYGDLNDLPNGDLSHSAIYMEHGIVDFGLNRRLKFGQIETKLDTEGLRYRGKQTKNGKEYVILNTYSIEDVPSSGEEIWVDLDKKSFISRYIKKGGATIFDLEIQSGYQDDFYYPKSWQLTITIKGKIDSIEKAKITSILVNPGFNDKDFEGAPLRPNEVVRIITYSPKSSIYRGLTANYTYKIDDQLKPVLVSKEPFKSYAPPKEEYPKERFDWLQKQQDGPREKTKPNWQGLGIFIGLLILLLGTIYLLGRRKRKTI